MCDATLEPGRCALHRRPRPAWWCRARSDLTTFGALGVHGTVAVTAVTAQHLDRVDRVEPIAPDLVAQQIDAITDSFRIDAVKTGLLGSAEIVDLVADRVVSGVLPAPVVDPVLVDGRGNRFVGSDVERSYRERLLPLAAVVTPNLGEASLLAGRTLRSVDDVDGVAAALAALGAKRVVVTGGASSGTEAIDVVVAADGSCDRLVGPWVETRHVRGSGCTFAAAVAAELGRGEEATAGHRGGEDLRESTARRISVGSARSGRSDLALVGAARALRLSRRLGGVHHCWITRCDPIPRRSGR